MRVILAILLFPLITTAVFASDAAKCVQTFLNAAHFDVGAVDGQLGRRSKAQAMLLTTYNPSFDLPPLSEETAEEWCTFAGTDAAEDLIAERGVIATVAMRDLPGPKRLWQVYDNAADCDAVRGEPEKLALRTKDIAPFDKAAAETMRRVFPQSLGAPMCKPIRPPRIRAVPEPVVDVMSGGIYSPGLESINRANEYLRELVVAYRYDGDEAVRRAIEDVLVTWADANAFSKGLRQPEDLLSVEFDWLEVLPVFLVAFNEVGPAMAIEERVRVGQWLRRLVGETEYSAWGAQRQDNKNYLRNYVALLWAIMTDDSRMREAAIAEFKDAIYDMRPDGSFPRDSVRGGNGLHYAHRSTMMLVAIATVAKLVGEDLFAYEKDGRSLHTAINWIAVTTRFPDLNARHARACPNSSFEGTTPEKPDMQHTRPEAVGVGSIYSWADTYLSSSSAAPEVAALLAAALPAGSNQRVSEPTVGGYFTCYATNIEASQRSGE